MRVVVTAKGRDLDSQVDPRFGRCEYLLLIDMEAGKVVVHDNHFSRTAQQGAGVQAAQAVAQWGGEALLTGHVGIKARAILEQAQVVVHTKASGTVRDALRVFAKKLAADGRGEEPVADL